jgi:hypothetical protein
LADLQFHVPIVSLVSESLALLPATPEASIGECLGLIGVDLLDEQSVFFLYLVLVENYFPRYSTLGLQPLASRPIMSIDRYHDLRGSLVRWQAFTPTIVVKSTAKGDRPVSILHHEEVEPCRIPIFSSFCCFFLLK